MFSSRLVLRAAGSLPVAVDGGFTAAHQEDRDTFHQRCACTKVDGASIIGADADVDADADADAAPVIHSSFRARREAAFPGHPSEIREQQPVHRLVSVSVIFNEVLEFCRISSRDSSLVELFQKISTGKSFINRINIVQ